MARRVRRMVAVALTTLVVLAIGGVSARGQEASLFGFDMTATGTAISSLYNQPSFGVPSDPTFELRKIYSLAELTSGPSSHALGSIVWPGQVIGNAPPSLAFDTLVFNPTQLDAVTETCFPEQLSPITDNIPEDAGFPDCLGLNPLKSELATRTEGRGAYPVRAEAFYPSDMTQSKQDVAGGLSMEAISREDIADAASKTGGSGLQGVVTYDSIYSQSTTEVIKGVAVSKSVTHISDLDLFGAIHIDSLTATAVATSDGVNGKVGGSLDIGGMLIKDQDGKPAAQFIVDKTGIRFRTFDKDGEPVDQFKQDPLGQITKAIFADQLAEQGIDLFLGQPLDTISGPAASRTLNGLVVHLDARGMDTLLANMPEDVRNTLKNPTSNHTISDPIFGDNGVLSPYVAGLVASFFQGDQDINFVFGSVGASSAASPPLPEFPLPEIPPVLPPSITPPFLPGTTGGQIVTPPAPGPGTINVPLQAVGSVAIPFEVVAAIILAGLIGSSRMRLFADRLLSARAATRCPLGETER
jgi:hypothetical protein